MVIEYGNRSMTLLNEHPKKYRDTQKDNYTYGGYFYKWRKLLEIEDLQSCYYAKDIDQYTDPGDT